MTNHFVIIAEEAVNFAADHRELANNLSLESLARLLVLQTLQIVSPMEFPTRVEQAKAAL